MNQNPSRWPAADRVHRALPAVLLIVCVVSPALAQQRREHVFHLPGVPHYYQHRAIARGLDSEVLRSVDNAPADNPVTDLGATLGRVLFYDKRLSRNRQRSCSSCHKQAHGFADPVGLSSGFEGKLTGRNSMGLTNLAYYKTGRFFWDERGKTLEEMVLMPIQDPIEMGMELNEVVRRLRQDDRYAGLFNRAFGDSGITQKRIGKALAQFLRAMVSFRTKFDRGLAAAGKVENAFPNFSTEENLGKRIFLGLHDGERDRSCASCHMQTLSTDGSGDVAPVLLQSPMALNNGVDDGRSRHDDPGLGRVTRQGKDIGKFKAPSLRNIELTAPYMHDGRFDTLAEVIDMYTDAIKRHRNLDARLRPDRSGGWGHRSRRSRSKSRSRRASRSKSSVLAAPATPSSFPPRRRGLGYQFTAKEQAALLTFLKTLTDHELVRDHRFSDPFR